MNLSFDNTQNAFSYKTTLALKKSKFLIGAIQHPLMVYLATKLIPWSLKIGLPIDGIIKRTVFEQFVGGETLQASARVAKLLAAQGVQVILDYGVEAKEGEDNFDKVTEEIIAAIDFAATQDNIPFISVKLTGIASHVLLAHLNEAPRLRSGIHESEFEHDAWLRVKRRMFAICDVADEKGVGILLDAEESWIQDPIDKLAIELMNLYNKQKVVVFNTFQMYRHDRFHFLQLSHKIAVEQGFILGAKLVRGAYMEKERTRAQQMNYLSPIQQNKEATDSDFNAAAQYCLENNQTISLLLATHNELSNLKIAQEMEKLGLPNNSNRVHFSQLYGMGDHITFNIAKEGYSVSKYLPFGPIKEVIPYLMRRAEENSSVNGQTNKELIMIKKELARRKSASNN